MTSDPAPPRSITLPAMGLAALALGAALILLLQILPPTDRINPVRRTISEYALSSNKWIFDLAVLLVALGSAAAFAGLVRHKLLPVRSFAVLLGALWTVSLLVVIVFPKHNWAIGPSTGGNVHRIASVVGFVCLPVAVLLAARIVFRHSLLWRRLAQFLAVTSLLWFGAILVAVGIMATGGPPWWQLLPLGLVERGMAVNELLAVATLAVPLLRRATVVHAPELVK
ncbi:DUF998 domain-containing protein [Amycolatopsis nigrescens]|uniref:DUF998 domain-containing protein n=1 Tax=Amycolatopsis nigrescens TaxID=381445 RepID=UPI0003697AAE|nr:DUF998 domain-containing protein [Amycolatopsis nigrescens]